MKRAYGFAASLVAILAVGLLAACGSGEEETVEPTGIASTATEKAAVAQPASTPVTRRTPVPTPKEPAVQKIKQYDDYPAMTIDPEKSYTATF